MYDIDMIYIYLMYIRTCCCDNVATPRLCVCWLHWPVEALACKDFVNRACLLTGTTWEEGVVCDAISTGFVAAARRKEES